MILTFSDFMPSKQSAAGKMMPPKAKATDGKTYALVKAVVDLVEYSLGTPLECSIKTEVNGKYTNYTVISAKHVASAAGPESPPTISQIMADASRAVESATSKTFTAQEGQSPTPAAPAWQNSDAARQRLIVRQSSLRAAIEWLNAEDETPEEVLELAEKFTDWVFEETADTPSPEKNAPHAITPAQQIVEQMREKTADIRSSYRSEDAVCPNCGRKEFLKQWSGGWFCARSKVAGEPGGCGYPAKGERLDAPVTYGEWLEKQGNIRRPDAAVVSPSSLPSRTR